MIREIRILVSRRGGWLGLGEVDDEGRGAGSWFSDAEMIRKLVVGVFFVVELGWVSKVFFFIGFLD